MIWMLVAAGLILAGAWFLLDKSESDRDWAELQAKLSEQRLAFAMQLPAYVTVPPERSKLDRSQLMTWHRSAIERIVGEHPKHADRLDYLKKVERWVDEGKKSADEAKLSRDRYAWLKGEWDNTMKTASYEPVLSGTNGAMKLDIVKLAPFVPPNGGPAGLRMDMLLWGAAKDQVTFSSMEITTLREVEKPDGKKIRVVEQTSTNSPPNVIHPSGPNPAPMDWITEWPPGVSAGYYIGLPKFPADATKYTLRMNIQSRTHGGTSVGGTIEWKAQDVPAEWKAADSAPVSPTMRDANPADLVAGGFLPEEELKQ